VGSQWMATGLRSAPESRGLRMKACSRGAGLSTSLTRRRQTTNHTTTISRRQGKDAAKTMKFSVVSGEGGRGSDRSSFTGIASPSRTSMMLTRGGEMADVHMDCCLYDASFECAYCRIVGTLLPPSAT
jgi:hypothetical protein